MTTTSIRRTVQTAGTKLAAFGLPLLVGVSGTATAHGGTDVRGGGIMGGGWGGMGGFGILGGMFLWPLLLVGLVLLVGFGLDRRTRTDGGDSARAALRERYARGDLTDDEFVERTRTLEEMG